MHSSLIVCSSFLLTLPLESLTLQGVSGKIEDYKRNHFISKYLREKWELRTIHGPRRPRAGCASVFVWLKQLVSVWHFHPWDLEVNKSIVEHWDAFQTITKTCLYNFDPLKPHFYIVKLGFTGVYIIFLISAQKHRLWVLVRTAFFLFLLQNIDCGYSLEPPHRGGSNEYPQSMFLSKNKKNRRGGSNEYPQSMFLSRNKKNNVEVMCAGS